MKPPLLILLVLSGVISVRTYVPRRYYLIQPGDTWDNAQTFCRTNYVDLATVDSPENMLRLQEETSYQQINSSVWIGLYKDFTIWRWSMGNEPLDNFTYWEPDEPNFYGHIQDCVKTSYYGWNDRHFSGLYAFICFDDHFTGNDSYIYYSNELNWRDAQTFCRKHHTDLVSVRNQTELSITQAMVSSSTWIGLYRDLWKWSDQTNVTTIFWDPEQPDNYWGSEDCVSVYNSQAGDAQCTEIYPYFCYSVITGEQQIIKIRIQSNQDLNNLAVKAAFLQKLQLKLQEHGVVRIKLTWRQQADGNVFHLMQDEQGVM